MEPEAAPAGRRSSTRTLVVGVAIVVAVLVGVGVVAARGGPDAGAPGLDGAPPELGKPSLQDRPAPDEQFALPDRTLEGFAGGDPIDLSDFAGEPLVVNFWASWCAPCVEEMPDFQTVAAESEGDVTFLGVDVQDAPRNAESFVEEVGVTYPLAVDPRGDYWRETRSYGMPTTLFVDPEGNVVYRHTGALDAEQLRDLLRTRLGVDV